MIITVEKWDGLTGETACFPFLKVMEQKLGCSRRESCIGWGGWEASEVCFSSKILSPCFRKRHCTVDFVAIFPALVPAFRDGHVTQNKPIRVLPWDVSILSHLQRVLFSFCLET